MITNRKVTVELDAGSKENPKGDYRELNRNAFTNVRRSSLFPVNESSIYLADLSLGVLQESAVQREPVTPLSSDDEDTSDKAGKPTVFNTTSRPATGPRLRDSAVAHLAVIKIKQQRRKRKSKRHFVVNCLRVGLTLLFYAGLSSAKPKPFPKTFARIQKVRSLFCNQALF